MTVPKWVYRYRVTSCPECKHDLTQPGGITLVLSVAEQEVETPTRLSPAGKLVDVDRLVENGYHSETRCAKCRADLVCEEQPTHD